MSDQFEQNIFLIRFPHALLVDHAQELELDTFTVFKQNGQGLNMSTAKVETKSVRLNDRDQLIATLNSSIPAVDKTDRCFHHRPP